jgi:signal transduction histidine kinase
VTPLRAALAFAGLVLGVWAYELNLHGPATTVPRSIAAIVVAWTFLVAGLIAWSRRPGNRVGPLMIWVAFALLLRKLAYSHDELVFTLGFLLAELNYAAFVHAVFAYPSGRVTSRAERALLFVGYPFVVALPLASLLVYDPSPPPYETGLFDCLETGGCAQSAIAIHPDRDLFLFLRDLDDVVVLGVLGTVFIALIVRRLLQSTPHARGVLWPLLVAALSAALRGVTEAALTLTNHSGVHALYWAQVTTQEAVPITMLIGLLQMRLARASVADLLPALERTPPAEIRDALARALHDPSLEVAFWLPERKAYCDADGHPVELDRARAVTELFDGAEPLAAIVHDPALLDEPKLVAAAGSAATLALQNARLQADLRAQLAKVRESRARIVTAGDEVRRRVERNIHDGAQQRLVSLALELRLAERRLHAGDRGDVDRVLASAVVELQGAVTELRELAQGIHPAVLTDEGLTAALQLLAARSTVPVSIGATPDRRLAPEIEAAAYYVAAEGLTNAAKHASASRVKISAERENGMLVVEVADDGCGGADPSGAGLRGLADRVEAHGGRLRVEGEAGEGTRVVAEIPCAS